MKRILIILICLMMAVGCKKNNNQNIVVPTPESKKEEVIYYTKSDAQERLKEIAEDIYNNRKYLSYNKENGKYFISLKELRNNLKYDTKKIDNLEGLICDENETGVAIDIDNLNHTDYYGDPIITLMLCTPPKADNSEEQN